MLLLCREVKLPVVRVAGIRKLDVPDGRVRVRYEAERETHRTQECRKEPGTREIT